MVAVVTGNGLGLFNTSLNMLGGGGVLGQGSFGQAGGQALVNASNGNLVLQFTDRQLSGIGLDLLHTRTYNTQGAYNDADADGDGWRWDGECRVALNGELNATGSSVVRTTGDGHETLYRWNGTAYQSTDGDGAHDSLLWDAARSEWVWTDGSRRTEERYAGTSGRLVQVSDALGTRIDYSYDADGRLSSVKDASGQELVLVYNAAGRLERLDTRQVAGGALTQQVYYSYDAQGRLASVTTDLTPSDNSISDGKVYTTTYTYDGASLRIASVSQSDGTSVSFTYELVAGEYRVKTVTDASGVTTFSYDPANRRTDITNGLNQQWSYFNDEAERLVEVRTPAVNGQRLSTRYAYDADGNVTQVTDGRGNSITYGYDANGNRVLERDAQGNTLRRVYDANNQLLNEIRYSQPAVWNGSAWNEPPADSAQTVRYAYDAEGRLRYVVSAGGVVSEYRYNGQGQRIREISYGDKRYDLRTLAAEANLDEVQLSSWASARDLSLSGLTELVYDYRGNLQRSTRYAVVDASGAGVLDATTSISEYIYGERGELLNSFVLRGNDRSRVEQSSFGYDGLGRLLNQSDASGTRTYAYDSVGRTVAVTNSAGLTTTQAYDARGRLLSLSETAANLTPRLTQYVYDAAGRQVMVQDATGVRTYTFYDEAGRLSAQVNGLGAVIEYRYNETGQKISETRYATLADTSGWYSGGAMTKTLVSEIRPAQSSAQDRTLTYAYDEAGRLSSSTDAQGYVTTYQYDGRGQLVQTQNGERVTRTFYDLDGRVAAVLDGEGYFRLYGYNQVGQHCRTVRFASATDESLRATGTLNQLRMAQGSAVEEARYYYDAAGRHIGGIDEKGIVTEIVYDEANNQQQTIRYATPYNGAVTAFRTSFASICSAVSDAGGKQVSTTVYDDYGRVSQRIGIDGSVTAYEYDSAGRLVREIRAQGTSEARTSTWRYDALGQTLGKLTGEGASRLLDGMTEQQIQATYAQYGLTYAYDAAGRQLSVSDAAGNTLLSYYDAAGRLTHTVNKLGEVTETAYNAFGEAISRTRFNDRLSDTAGLSGGLLTTPLSALTQAMRSNAGNSTTHYAYDQRGQLASSIDALGYVTTYGYNRFGEQSSIARSISQGQVTTTQFNYNKRGELIGQTEDIGGLARSTATQYDAFGRVIARTDGRGLTSTIRYDQRGRVVVTTNPLNQSQATEYDAFGRVLTQTDALGRVTRYAYDDANRTLTQTLPDGVQVVTRRNRHGETLSITDGNGNTTSYSYNKDGQLLTSTNALNQVTTHAYEAKSGFKLSTTDAAGNVTRYSYDELGRTLSVTNALNVVTRYDYDGLGRKVRTTEAEGTPAQRITDYVYDAKDQLLQVIQDPDGLKLSTSYQYDGLGRQLEVSRGTVAAPRQQVTRYDFDNLGRRVAEYIDPDGLNLTTRYVYNGNDQVEQKIQVLNASTNYITRYAYDDAGRLLSTTDALGYTESYTYDAAGNRKTLTNKNGHVWHYNYDVRNRLVEEISPQVIVNISGATNGGAVSGARHVVTQYTYDAVGNIVRRVEGILRNSVSGSDELSQARTSHMIYDALGRVRYSIDGLNLVNETIYDNLGRISQTKRFSKAIAADVVRTEAATAAALAAAGAQARTTTQTYDVVGRTLSVTDAAGKKESYTYDAVGNRKTLTNKNGHVWNYNYDSAGRLSEEISPVVSIASHTDTGTFEWVRDYRVVTSIAYDALGNVVSRTEGCLRTTLNAAPSADYMKQARTTTYGYDAAGRQVRTTSPGWYNKAKGQFVGASDGTTNTFQVSTEVRYDALGNATSNKVRINNSGVEANDFVVSHKVYDGLGRVTHDIDAQGGVIAYGYDALGNQVSLTRYANGVTGADLSTLVLDVSKDRTIRTEYDALGRKSSVRHPTSEHYLFKQPGTASGFYLLTPTTQYRYNAFGELVRETLQGVASDGSVLMQGADTTYYYDQQGRQVGSVNALGYYTQQEYDAYGSVTRRVEYNKALTAWNETTLPAAPAASEYPSPDRITRFVYDAMGRLTQTIYDKALYWVAKDPVTMVSSGTLTANTVTYDGLGNILTSTDALGDVTTNEYDALGRLAKITLPKRNAALAGQLNSFDVAGVMASPIWKYVYNAFGQVTVHTTEAGIGTDGRAQAGGTRFHLWQYDAAGHTISQMEPNGSYLHFKVDVAGRRIEDRREIDVTTEAFMTIFGVNLQMKHTIRRTYEYDKLGQQTAVVDWYNLYDAALKATPTSMRNTTTYNRFGEVTEKRINGALQEQASYDLNGRLVTRKTAEKGEERFAYDANGKLSYAAQLGSVGVTADDRTTYYLNDRLGRAIEQHLPAFEANTNDPLNTVLSGAPGKVTPIIKQTFDHWGNLLSRTDPRNNTTKYTYDYANRLTDEIGHQTVAYREDGSAFLSERIQRYGYDVTGNLIVEQDYASHSASGYTLLRTRYHLYNNGNLVWDIDASGASRFYMYDAYGNRVATQDARGTRFFNTYNAMDRQIGHGVMRNGAAVLLLTNKYDQAGRLYAEISGTTETAETLRNVADGRDGRTYMSGVAGNTRYTIYDERGNITWTRNESGANTQYQYDGNNRKIKEVDAVANTKTWTYSAGDYSKLLSYKDWGNHYYTYIYNDFGQLEREQVGGAPDKVYYYFSNGLTKSISERTPQSGVVTNSEYDVAGNKVREITISTTNGGTASEWSPSLDTRYQYDSLNRLQSVKVVNGGLHVGWGDMVSQSARLDQLSYFYDALGNRRRVVMDTTNQTGGRTWIDNWFKYDLEGRVLVEDGFVNGKGLVVAGTLNGTAKGRAYTYDGAGNRISSEEFVRAFDFFGTPAYEYNLKNYTYNDLGSLLTTTKRASIRNIQLSPDTSFGALLGDATLIFSASYDVRNNRIRQEDINGGEHTITNFTYRGDGKLNYQLIDRWNGSRWKPYQWTFFNETRQIGTDGVERDILAGYNAAGLSVRYRYTVYDKKGDPTMWGENYTTHIGFDTWKEQRIQANVNSGTPGVTTMDYTVRGDLVTAVATGKNPFTRRYAANRYGQLIMRTEGNNATAQTYVMHNGNVLASIGNGGTPEIYDTITSMAPDDMANTPSNYVIVDGDTLPGIAQKIWGDSGMWYLIADANGLSASDALVRGTSLNIPNVAGSHANNADTFKAYDQSEVSGELTPTPIYKPPKPKKKKKSGGLSSVVMAVVAVVAAVFTAGAALAAAGAIGTAAGATVGGLASAAWAGGVAALTTGTFVGGGLGATIAAGALGGAVGSAAGQLSGMAMGVVDSFSWSQVAVGALAGGITGGIGHLAQTSNVGWVKAASEITSGGGANASPWQVASAYAVKGVSDYAASQVANRVVGLNTSFSWGAVAASAAGSVVGGAVGRGTAQWGRAGVMLGDQVGAHASAAMSDKWFGGARPDYGQVAVDAFGNSLANSIVDQLRQPSAETLRKALELANVSGDETYIPSVRHLLANGATPEQVGQLYNDPNMRPTLLHPTKAGENGTFLRYEGDGVWVGVQALREPITVSIDGGAERPIGSNTWGDWANTVTTPVHEGMTGVARFAEAHPNATRLIGFAVQGASYALMGPMAAMRDIATQAVLGPVLDQARDYAISRIDGYYQSKGVKPENAGILASGTLFGVEAIAGRIGDAVTGAKQYAMRMSRGIVPNSNVDDFVSGLYRKETPTHNAAGKFEVEQTGQYNYRVHGGGTTMDIDGYNGTTMLEAKFVGKPTNSPYADDSKVPEFLRAKILKEQQYEIQRYKAIIDDPAVPFNRLDILTNEPKAVPYFQSLMDQHQVPGSVNIVNTKIPQILPRQK